MSPVTVKREISLGDIIKIGLLLLGAGGVVATLKSDDRALAMEIASNREYNVVQDRAITEILVALKDLNAQTKEEREWRIAHQAKTDVQEGGR